MPTISLKVDKADVWNEVALTSSYTGDKLTDADENAYNRILITDEDQKSLQRFWEEAVAVANDHLKEMFEAASAIDGDYDITLNVSKNYDTTLNAGAQAALRSYFILAITARWYKFSNKEEADSYMNEAGAMMGVVKHMLYSRKRPARPSYRE